MTGLLIWSYANEKVRFSRPAAWSPKQGGAHSNADSVRRTLSLGAVIPGHGHNSRAACHDDADLVHSYVLQLVTDDYWLIVNAAEAGCAPDWNPDIELGQMEPVLTSDGKIKMLRDRKSCRPIACLGRFVGLTPSQRQLLLDDAREKYARWWHLLWMLRETISAEDRLTRWQVTGVGAEREPWTQSGHVCVDRADES